MIEMIVVISIILLVLTLVLPSVSAIWSQRKAAQAENQIQGMLMASRSDAIQSNLEKGFLAFVDEEGNQHLMSIEKVQPNNPADQIEQLGFQNVFQIVNDRLQTLPKPYRVVPRYTVDPSQVSGDEAVIFSDEELINHDFFAPNEDAAPGQRHRNFFTMIFSPEGNLIHNREVLIVDIDEDDDAIGDRTKLPIAESNNYVHIDFATMTVGINELVDGFPFPIANLIVRDPDNGGTAALNFPSVDGVIVYNEQEFQNFDQDQVRTYLIRNGQPLYVSRFTGSVIRGSIGEEETTP